MFSDQDHLSWRATLSFSKLVQKPMVVPQAHEGFKRYICRCQLAHHNNPCRLQVFVVDFPANFSVVYGYGNHLFPSQGIFTNPLLV